MNAQPDATKQLDPAAAKLGIREAQEAYLAGKIGAAEAADTICGIVGGISAVRSIGDRTRAGQRTYTIESAAMGHRFPIVTSNVPPKVARRLPEFYEALAAHAPRGAFHRDF